MKKELKDYAPFYLGCGVIIESDNFIDGDKPDRITDTLIEAGINHVDCKNYTPPIRR